MNTHSLKTVLAISVLALATCARADDPPTAAPAAVVRMLAPGFVVRELPVKLTSLNNIEYAPDGRLFAAGYDGRFHVLTDSDGDGVEDKVATFVAETSPNYPLGLAVKEGQVYAVLADEVIRFRDTDGDGVPDQREIVAHGFDDPDLAAAPYLNHRRVDSAMALALAPDGAIYITMGNAGYNNAYWHDKQRVAHYSPDKRRGCLLRISPSGQVEQLASGLRYIMSLQWNRHGDLFATDQEGATWVPNGNPADELLHLQPGRHYGFPPRHPMHLPSVIDEPSLYDYTPQHQSTCGFRFNGPAPGRGRFGPEFWADDALITGESRGKLWRTTLAKTAAGYVARTQLIASIGMLAVDCAISPQGDLVVCCHSGRPDWGNGPSGAGRVFKISYSEHSPAQPVLIWPETETQTIVAFDRPLLEARADGLAVGAKAEFGAYVAAADRLEADRPGYAVVQAQQRQPRHTLPIKGARLSADRRSVLLETSPRNRAANYALILDGGNLDLAHDLTGLAAQWRGDSGQLWAGWLPHPDFIAARAFTRGSNAHDELWKHIATAGALQFSLQLDLFNMLQPATQPGAELDYTPEPETVTVVFQSDAALKLAAASAEVERISEHESRVKVSKVAEAVWHALTLELATPAKRLDVSYFTALDPRPRALAPRRFLMPFARPSERDLPAREIPELAGGDWQAGRTLFRGKAACVTCHTFRGDGASFGPDISNLAHRDYASVMRDLLEPSAVIHPDAVGYLFRLENGTTVSGTRLRETAEELQIGQPGDKAIHVRKADIAETVAMKLSLMPAGLDKILSPEELRNLVTYLLNDEPRNAKPNAKAATKKGSN